MHWQRLKVLLQCHTPLILLQRPKVLAVSYQWRMGLITCWFHQMITRKCRCLRLRDSEKGMWPTIWWFGTPICTTHKVCNCYEFGILQKKMSQVLSQCMLLLFRHLLTGFWIHLYVQHFSCSTRHWTIFVMMTKDSPVSLSVAGWLLSRTSCCW